MFIFIKPLYEEARNLARCFVNIEKYNKGILFYDRNGYKYRELIEEKDK